MNNIMKRIIIIFALLVAVACQKENDEQNEVATFTIDFEDSLFDSDVAEVASSWNFVLEGYS